MRLSRNFTLSELSCNCGKCDTEASDISTNLVYRLQQLRESFGLPLRINSGYRCPDHNKAIGGAAKSQHVLGKAADIDLSNFNSKEKYRLLQLAFRLGTFSGIGISSNFIHLDVRDSEPVMWTY